VRIELDESGGSRNLCLLDPLDPRIARVLIDRARRGWLRVSPAVPRGRPGGPWIEDRVVWLRRAKPLETVLVEHPSSGAGVRDLEALALADRARFVELGRLGSADSLAAYDRMAARLEGAVPAPARLDALDPLDHPSWLPETRWSVPVPASNACPTLPVSAAVRDDGEPIVQAAFLASFGTSWPSLPLFPSASMPRVHFRGYAGPVLYGVSPGEYVSQRGTYLEWEVVNRREDSAAVLFGASAKDTGSRFKLTVYLQRHKAKWYAVAVDGLSWHVDGV
jgi:hypothetical protein